MILFHAKANGQVTTTPSLVPQGSSMQDLVVLSEFDYALCTIKLQPASGIYIPDIACNFIETDNKKTLWTAKMPPEATRVSGNVNYQLLFTAADGTQQTTLSGTFNVPKGIITNMPESAADLQTYTIESLYMLLSNIYAKISDASEPILSRTVTIKPTEWTDAQPYMALLSLSGLTEGTVTLFIPENDATKEAAAEARLTMEVDRTQNNNVGGQYAIMARVEGGAAPTIDMSFRYMILKTGTADKALVAMIGVDAVGKGGGSGGSIKLEDDGEGNFTIVTTGGGTVNLVDDGEGNFTLEVQ